MESFELAKLHHGVIRLENLHYCKGIELTVKVSKGW